MRFISVSEHLLALSGTGLVAMGIMNWIGDDDGDASAPEDVSADGGDDLFGEMDSGDDFGGMDDDFGDDFGGMDDDFGGDMGGGDDWGDGGGGSNQLFQDMENRVDGLESEVAEISSTINTVRSENEEISESVDEIEENVRKLLEIYEMVTRGVNPFVDDVQGGQQMGGSAFGGDFGLFEDDDAGDSSTDEELDDDVMGADAESFFDDDALDDFEAEETEEFEDDVDEEFEVDLDDEPSEETESSASSFQELKAEYESGDADWADGESEAESAESLDAEAGDVEAFELEAEEEDDFEVAVELEEETSDESTKPVTVEDEFEFDETVEEPSSTGQSGEKPYLTSLPSGYVVDLVVMEWLEFLIGEFSAEEAARTIEYYERIEWISESVSEDLHSFLEGLADVEREDESDLGPIELDIDDHLESLTFISQLTGDSIQRKIVDHCAQIRGEGRGIQR